MSEKPSFEIRNDDKGKIDEVIASDCFVHIERMRGDCFYVGITMPNGHLHQLWIESDNGRSRIGFGHYESVPKKP